MRGCGCGRCVHPWGDVPIHTQADDALDTVSEVVVKTF